jgi:hypothetical protein
MCYCFFDAIEVRSWQRWQALEWVEAYISYQSWVSHGTIYPEALLLFIWSLARVGVSNRKQVPMPLKSLARKGKAVSQRIL